MSSERGGRPAAARRASAARAVIAALLLALGPVGPGAAVTEGDLFRQVKVDVFDQNWPAVLSGCEELLKKYPSGPSAPQAEFYRARALTRMPGREGQGLEAFRRFVSGHPRDGVMVEEAWAAIFSTACSSRAQAAACGAALREGLASPSPYVSMLAAIHASDSPNEALRARAIPALKKAYAAQTDQEIRNEILIAILKIDPQQVPQTDAPAPSAASPGAPRRTAAPSLIRMTVYNKQERRYDLKVNLPVAFARMLVEAVGDQERKELQREARRKGIDLDDIFRAIEKSGAGKLLEVDDDTCHIEIWIE
ncbi:MAG TPA: hypothetical protein VEO94_00330 [Candidatus Dormibacteraeota bacterium]|nr:hypothetical protein [Candidatus Dormibacteraeota bacterium]